MIIKNIFSICYLLITSIILSCFDILYFKGPAFLLSSYFLCFFIVSFKVLLFIFKKRTVIKYRYVFLFLLFVSIIDINAAYFHDKLIQNYVKSNHEIFLANSKHYYGSYYLYTYSDGITIFEQFGWQKKVFNSNKNIIEDIILD